MAVRQAEALDGQAALLGVSWAKRCTLGMLRCWQSIRLTSGTEKQGV